MENNIFEQASRQKLRFASEKGSLTVEQLWDLSLPKLDELAKSLNRQLKDSNEETYFVAKTKADELLQLAFEVVLHIGKVKLQEKTDRDNAAAKAQQRAKILELIERKEDQQREGKTVEELRQELAALL